MVKELTSDNFEENVKGVKCVIDFWAVWCGPCRMMSPVIDELSEEKNELKFYKINVDEQPALADKFGISSIPTIVVLDNSKEISRTLGYMPKAQLVSELGI